MQDDVNPQILRMLEDTFSLDAILYFFSSEDEKKDQVTTVYGDIRPEEIPEVPSNKFLYRGDKQDLDKYVVLYM